MTRPRVLVVGAGILGASCASHLQRAGAQVTVVEAGERGGRATRDSWAWINASHGNPEPYFRLRVRSMADWRALETDVDGVSVDWCGGLFYDLDAGDLARFAENHAAWGYDIRLIDGEEARRLEPRLVDPPAVAVHAAGEGAVDAVAVALALLADAERAGAAVHENRAVLRLTETGGRVTGAETDAGPIEADHVVLCCGTGTAELAATAGAAVPMSASPGSLVRSEPAERLVNGLVMSPGLHVRQLADGRLLGGADFGGGGIEGGHPAEAAEAVFEILRGRIDGAGGLALDGYSIGQRPMPDDGFPIVGPVPGVAGLHLVVTHSGVTLAPALGRMVAEEILTGRRDGLLTPFGPERFRP